MKSTTRRFVVIGVFLLLSWLVFSPVASAQTPTPPPTRESLIEEIKLRAQRDVDNGKPMETTEGLDRLFGEQAKQIGMSLSEVVNAYENEYSAVKAAGPWWEGLLPNLGWVAAIVAILVAAFRGVIEEASKKFFNKVGTTLYNRVARYRPFWMFALRKYRQSLENTYRELKIPFRAGRPLQMQDVYVPVRVEGGSKQQVDAYQTIQGQKRLVVLGDPGSGKTMLLRHVAFTYARQGLYDFPGQPIPVFLELNRVENAGNSLLDALTKALKDHNFPGAEGFLKSALANQSLLILLDGLDEVNAAARPALVKQIQDLDQKYAGNRIIVTCRKAVYQGELDGWVDQKLEIVEFSDQQIQRFMTSWQKDMPAEKSIEHLFRTLQERPQIMALARIPLLLTMVAYLYVDTEFALPHSRSEFYSRSTDLLLDQWHGERNHYKSSHKRTVLQRLALFNQNGAGKTGERRTLELAEALKEIREMLPDLTLKVEDAQPLLDEIIQRSGLMLAIDGGTRYQFTHLTLQEYFAARALEAEPKTLLESYKANPDAWREVVRLWCALEHDSTAMLKALYALNPMMAFECLSDAQQVDNVYADELIENFKPSLSEEIDSASLSSTFAMLAADPRPRGKKWFEFIKSNLDIKKNRLAACAVLARTNIPQAAEPLAKIAVRDSSVIPFLVQLGNLAVPSLTEQAQRDEGWAMDALVDIGTPQAALALQPLLWINKEPVISITGNISGIFFEKTYQDKHAYHAAWRLAALLPLAGVEDALQTITLTSEQRKAKQIEWVWEPFSENVNIRVIAGRIGYLLHTTPENELPSKELPCDSRLALPICAVVGYDNLKKICENYKEKFQQKISLNQLGKNQVLPRIYSTLTTQEQSDLLDLFTGKISPTEDDWQNINKPVEYNFPTSWHVKALKLLLLLLVLLNLWGIWNQISQSVTWGSAGAVLVGGILLGGIIWTQRQTWTVSGRNKWFMVVSLGAGATLGVVVGELTQNWVIGSLVGTLSGTLGGVLFNALKSLQPIISLDDKPIVLVSVSALVGALVGILGSAWIVTLVVILIVFFLIVVLVARDIPGFIHILLAVLCSFLDLILTYFATTLLYQLAGLSITVMFWLAWLGSFYLLLFTSKRLERRAQNPLHDLLEPSGAAVSPRRAAGLWGRWFGSDR